MPCAIAIDGPAGAGKSTIARHLAARLRFIYVDTGALYRAVGYHILRQGISPEDKTAVIDALDGLSVGIRYIDGEQRVFVGEEDVSDRIRTPAVSMAASAVSALPQVRAFLLQAQRELAATHDVIMDGRDIGTTILPDADIKIFLTASAASRAGRRFAELKEKGIPATYDEVLADMVKRDYDDAHRAASPLRRAADAVLVDTSNDTLEQSIARMEKLVAERLPR